MEKKKRKPLATLHEDLLKIRCREPDPKAVEEFNELRRKDEEKEEKKS